MQHSTIHAQRHQMLGSKKLSRPEEWKELNHRQGRSVGWCM